MGLINEAPQENELTYIKISNTDCLRVMKSSAERVFNLAWNNPDYTPEQVFAAMGTEAAKAFQAHSKLQELIYLMDNTWVPLVPPREYVINEDGSVTIQPGE